MRSSRWVGATAILLVLGCADRGGRPARRYPPIASTPPTLQPTSSAVAPATVPLDLPVASPTTVSFKLGPAIEFRAGAALKPVPIAKQTAIHALSPDAKSWVIDGPNNTALLVSPGLPQPVSQSVWVPSARFSDDGTQVLIWSMSGLAVIEVATGKFLARRDGAICGARFSGPREIVFHEESKEADARFWRWAPGAPQPTALGAARKAETCQAAADGSLWLVESYAERSVIDGRTGGARVIAPPDRGGSLSPGGNRVCTGDDRGLSCLRQPDQRTERVWDKPTSDFIVFDNSGSHAMISYADGADGVRDAFALVSFEAQTVEPLRGVKGTSGSMFALTTGAKLLTIGSGSGLWVYDIERRQKRFAAHRPLYGNHVFPHHPRRVVAGTDEPMDLFLVDVP